MRTAVGIATLIQLPDRPTSLVLGDSNAFKVEYLENAITIKPLSHSARSNLYIYTEARRFNVSLVTAPLLSADYVVYLEPEIVGPDPKRDRWRDYLVEKRNPDVSVATRRIGKTNDLLLITFQVSAQKPFRFKPEWIWLTQGGRVVPIQDVHLSGVEISEKTPISGLLTVRTMDVRDLPSLVLEIRSRPSIKIRLPQVKSWLK